MKKYDVVVVGGGTAGCAAAYTCAKLGLKTLVVEKNIHLGGTMTSALVVPAMKTNGLDINCEFFKTLVTKAKEYNAQVTYCDGNEGWFNAELLKIVLDDLLTSVGCDILFNTNTDSVHNNNNLSFNLDLQCNMLSLCVETKFLIDSTGNAEISKKLNCNFLNSEKNFQSTSLRFTMANINLKEFSEWILKLDPDRNVTTSCERDGQIHLSTAYTWDKGRKWALWPIFEQAINNGDLKEEDASYFQVFTIPDMPTSLAFNCPRIPLNPSDEPFEPFNYAKLHTIGREQVYRIANFCKKYLPGFNNAYISNIADMLGIREFNRVEGQYVYTEEDIASGKTFENIALSCDYPIDIHSNKKDDSTLEFSKGNYYLPIEALISKKYDNLFVIGRCLSASFKAQAALRTQTSCFSMGEAVAKHIKKLQQPD